MSRRGVGGPTAGCLSRVSVFWCLVLVLVLVLVLGWVGLEQVGGFRLVRACERGKWGAGGLVPVLVPLRVMAMATYPDPVRGCWPACRTPAAPGRACVAPGRRRCMLPKKTLSMPTVRYLAIAALLCSPPAHLSLRCTAPLPPPPPLPAPALDVARCLPIPSFLAPRRLWTAASSRPLSCRDPHLRFAYHHPTRPSAAHYHPSRPDSFDPLATIAVPAPSRLLSLPSLTHRSRTIIWLCLRLPLHLRLSPLLPPSALPLHWTHFKTPATHGPLHRPEHEHARRRFHLLPPGLSALFLVAQSSQLLLRRSSLSPPLPHP